MTEPETVQFGGLTLPVVRDDRIPPGTILIGAPHLMARTFDTEPEPDLESRVVTVDPDAHLTVEVKRPAFLLDPWTPMRCHAAAQDRVLARWFNR